MSLCSSFFLQQKEPVRFPFFALAGLWDRWENPADGGRLDSFSIITTEANELMAPIHDRMPVILEEKNYERWLAHGTPVQPPADLLRPFDADRMTIAPAHPRVGNIRNQGPELLALNSR